MSLFSLFMCCILLCRMCAGDTKPVSWFITDEFRMPTTVPVPFGTLNVQCKVGDELMSKSIPYEKPCEDDELDKHLPTGFIPRISQKDCPTNVKCLNPEDNPKGSFVLCPSAKTECQNYKSGPDQKYSLLVASKNCSSYLATKFVTYKTNKMKTWKKFHPGEIIFLDGIDSKTSVAIKASFEKISEVSLSLVDTKYEDTRQNLSPKNTVETVKIQDKWNDDIIAMKIEVQTISKYKTYVIVVNKQHLQVVCPQNKNSPASCTLPAWAILWMPENAHIRSSTPEKAEKLSEQSHKCSFKFDVCFPVKKSMLISQTKTCATLTPDTTKVPGVAVKTVIITLAAIVALLILCCLCAWLAAPMPDDEQKVPMPKSISASEPRVDLGVADDSSNRYVAGYQQPTPPLDELGNPGKIVEEPADDMDSRSSWSTHRRDESVRDTNKSPTKPTVNITPQ